ncbi:unnamed protein product, partial [Trichobilharzia szidati]
MYIGTLLYGVPLCDIIHSFWCPVPQRVPCKSIQWSLDTGNKTTLSSSKRQKPTL